MNSQIFAENITRRARVLAGYAKADDAFKSRTSNVKFAGVDDTIAIAQLKARLTGYEMVVASTNNAAVDNISRDLPKTKSLGKKIWRTHEGVSSFTYLQPIAHKIAAQNKEGNFDELNTDDLPWGLISCALGSRENRGLFAESIRHPGNNPEKPYPLGLRKPYPKGFLPDKHQSIWQWRRNYKGLNFEKAKELFTDADKAVQEHINSLQEYASLTVELRDHNENSYIAYQAKMLEAAENIQREKASIFHTAETELAQTNRELEDLAIFESRIKNQKPGWFSRLVRTQQYKEYKIALDANHKKQNALLWLRAGLQPQRQSSKSGLDHANEALGAARSSFNARKQEWKSKRSKLARLQADFPLARCPHSSDQLEEPNWQRDGLWRDDKLSQARSKLFAAALQLHEAWLAEVLKPGGAFVQNIFAFCNLLSGKRLETPQHALVIWQSLFMIVPVVSSTFASIHSQFRDLEGGSLGWLFIDEAGQAVPQAAVGALWRCKRAVVVGDPLQIEPVFTVPIKLIESLFKKHELPDSLRVMPHKVSSQNVADSANCLGTEVDTGNNKREWIGIPLRVHRRCYFPMFPIANAIAYEGKMVYGLNSPNPPSNRLDLGKSAWIDLRGRTNQKQAVPEEIDAVFDAFMALYQVKQDFPPLYIISPFRRIKEELVSALSDIRRWKQMQCSAPPRKGDLLDWCKKNIGTVHTFQGKENSIVWMVLGCEENNPGPVIWASKKPNLLNVAITRAKHLFFVFGNKKVWANRGCFAVASRQLPTITKNDFLQRIRALTETEIQADLPTTKASAH